MTGDKADRQEMDWREAAVMVAKFGLLAVVLLLVCVALLLALLFLVVP